MAMDASGYQFQFYSEGIYSSTQCDSTHLNHAMLIVGYDSYHGDKYWIMKNRYLEQTSWQATFNIYIHETDDVIISHNNVCIFLSVYPHAVGVRNGE